MSVGLFRDEVLLARRNESLGSIRIQPPRLGWVCAGAGLLAIVALASLLCFGQYARREQATGSLVPSGGLLAVVPLTAGVVTRVRVHDGEFVRAGQPLIDVSAEQSSTRLGETEAAVANQLEIKRSRLIDDLNEQQRLTRQQSSELSARRNYTGNQISQKEAEVRLQKERAESSMGLYKQWIGLSDKGLVSKVQLLQQHDLALQNMATLRSLEGQLSELRKQLEQLSGEISRLPTTLLQRKNDIERQLADVAASAAQNAARRSTVLTAAIDGTVANVLVHPGQVIFAQQSLMNILPAGNKLEAELWVPSRAMGFIHPGETVILRYQAYPFQKFGHHTGRVVSVAGSPTLPTEIARLSGQDVDKPRYRVVVALDSQLMLAYGRYETLRPGMTMDADIILDRRRLIDWIIDPLFEMTDKLTHNHAVSQA